MHGLLIFLILLALSALVRSRFRHHFYSATAAGGSVMAIGIFADAALPQLPFHNYVSLQVLVLELGVIALFLAMSYLLAAVTRHFRMHISHPLRRFGIGTWVAAVAVLSVLILHALPAWTVAGRVLAVLAAALYVPYLGILLHAYLAMARHPRRLPANGIILLATVATQAVLLALYTAFPQRLPPLVILAMLAIGGLFYAFGLIFIVQHHHALRSRQLAVEWKNSNCIIHGAVSITGLVAAQTRCLGEDALLGIWFTAFILLLLVELLETLRLIERIATRGLKRGAFVYDTSQWTRNFTYGMFYAFTLALTRLPGMGSMAADIPWWPVAEAVVRWGQYAVLLFLLAEITLFFRAQLRSRGMARALQ